MASSIRIACTALMKRIQAGRINKEGTAFTGDPVDVTSDCLKAVIDFVGVDKTATVIENGIPAYKITVVKIIAPEQSDTTKGQA